LSIGVSTKNGYQKIIGNLEDGLKNEKIIIEDELLIKFVELNINNEHLNYNNIFKTNYIWLKNLRKKYKHEPFMECIIYLERISGFSGIFTLSRIAFNKDNDKALLYLENVVGPLCGSGGYRILIKKIIYGNMKMDLINIFLKL
jgi:hypothetical protein